MQFYWVNIGDSWREVAKHRFLWAPSNHSTQGPGHGPIAGWKHVPKVVKGDVVFCHENGRLLHVAVATSDAYPSPRPASRKFNKWKNEGFKIDVHLEELSPPVPIATFSNDLINLYNYRCDPKLFDVRRIPAQHYMVHLPPGAGALILSALGEVSEKVQTTVDSGKPKSNRVKATTREALINARVGQGQFREEVLDFWKSRCPITKVDMPELLIASHIVSWHLATDEEKVDRYNGLALSPAIDKLFDKGYVSFADSGRLLVHECMRTEIIECLGVSLNSRIDGLQEQHRSYLKRHRATSGFPERQEGSG